MMIDTFFMKILVNHTFANQMGILAVDLDKINLNDDNNFYEDYPDITIYVRLLTWCNKLERNTKHSKK